MCFSFCANRLRPRPCAGCCADFGSIAVVTETGADVTLVAGRLAGALIVTVMEMQLDGTSSVAKSGVCVCVCIVEGGIGIG